MPPAEALNAGPASENTSAATAVGQRRPSWPAVAALLVLTWPVRTGRLRVGIDGSWMTGLPMAAHDGLRFGHDLVFTYGPLGFLAGPFRYPVTGVLAIVIQVAVRGALLVAGVRVLGRVVPFAAAAVIVGLLVTLLDPSLTTAVLMLALGAGVAAVLALPRPPGRHELVLGGVAVGALLLVKADAGVVGLVVVGASAVAAVAIAADGPGGPWGRGRAALGAAALFGAGAAGSVVAGWLATGQRPGDLGVWLHGVASMASGYTSAMAVSREGRHLGPEVAAVVVAGAVFGVLVLRSDVDRTRRRAGLAVGSVALYLAFRQGFVRFDGEHVRQTYAVAFALVFGVLGVRAVARRAALAALLVVAVAYVPGQMERFGTFVDVGGRVRGAVESVRLVASPDFRRGYVASARSRLAGAFAVPDTMVARIGTGTVHVVPWSLLVLYAYPQLRWRPLPVFQDYAAHTTYLDDRNAARLRDPDGPQFVLRERRASIDAKLAQFEPPAENLELACQYRVVGRDRRWELLQRSASRCGAVEPSAPVRARYGADVEVPSAGADALVVARFSGVGASLADRLRTAVFRGPDLFVGSGGNWYRFVPGHQSSWHVLAVPACARAAVGPDLVDLGPLTVSDRAGPAGRSGGYTIEFARVPYRCA